MSCSRAPRAKSCTSPPASRSVPPARGAAMVPATLASSASRPRACRPLSRQDRVERGQVEAAGGAQVHRPGRRQRRACRPGSAGCARRSAPRPAAPTSPASVALAVSAAAGSPAAGPVRRRMPVAASRSVPVGRAGVPASLRIRLQLSLGLAGPGRRSPSELGGDVAQRGGQVERRAGPPRHLQHRLAQAEPQPVHRHPAGERQPRRGQQPQRLALPAGLQAGHRQRPARRVQRGRCPAAARSAPDDAGQAGGQRAAPARPADPRRPAAARRRCRRRCSPATSAAPRSPGCPPDRAPARRASPRPPRRCPAARHCAPSGRAPPPARRPAVRCAAWRRSAPARRCPAKRENSPRSPSLSVSVPSGSVAPGRQVERALGMRAAPVGAGDVQVQRPVRGARRLRRERQRRPVQRALGGDRAGGMAGQALRLHHGVHRAARKPGGRHIAGQVGGDGQIIGSAGGMALRRQPALQRPGQRRQVGQPHPPVERHRAAAQPALRRDASARARPASSRDRVTSAPCSTADRPSVASGPSSAGSGAMPPVTPSVPSTSRCVPASSRRGLERQRRAAPHIHPAGRRERGKIGQRQRGLGRQRARRSAPCPPARASGCARENRTGRPGVVQRRHRRSGAAARRRAGRASARAGAAPRRSPSSVAAPAWPAACTARRAQPRPGRVQPVQPQRGGGLRRGEACRAACASSATPCQDRSGRGRIAGALGGHVEVARHAASDPACRTPRRAARPAATASCQAGGCPLARPARPWRRWRPGPAAPRAWPASPPRRLQRPAAAPAARRRRSARPDAVAARPVQPHQRHRRLARLQRGQAGAAVHRQHRRRRRPPARPAPAGRPAAAPASTAHAAGRRTPPDRRRLGRTAAAAGSRASATRPAVSRVDARLAGQQPQRRPVERGILHGQPHARGVAQLDAGRAAARSGKVPARPASVTCPPVAWAATRSASRRPGSVFSPTSTAATASTRAEPAARQRRDDAQGPQQRAPGQQAPQHAATALIRTPARCRYRPRPHPPCARASAAPRHRRGSGRSRCSSAAPRPPRRAAAPLNGTPVVPTCPASTKAAAPQLSPKRWRNSTLADIDPRCRRPACRRGIAARPTGSGSRGWCRRRRHRSAGRAGCRTPPAPFTDAHQRRAAPGCCAPRVPASQLPTSR